MKPHERRERATAIVKYNGDVFDPASSDDELSLSIIKGCIDKMEHRCCEEEPFTNMVSIEIK